MLTRRYRLSPMERAVTRVGFDESGNTGPNLLDPEQPLYVLAAVQLDEDDAKEIVAAHLGQARELRYGQLVKRPFGRRKILEVLNDGRLTAENARVTPVHKEFMVAAKLFDQLMEPSMYERGYDVYDRGIQVLRPSTFGSSERVLHSRRPRIVIQVASRPCAQGAARRPDVRRVRLRRTSKPPIE